MQPSLYAKVGAAIPFFSAEASSRRRCASTGDEGARRLIGALEPGELVEVETPDTGVTFDIDTPEDLAAATGRRELASGGVTRLPRHAQAADSFGADRSLSRG